eukprot:m.99136 g.99136  ORF g.99136 m.99136 type:complete len:1696 (+) comp13667_c0_seq2:354-5441(+)
MKDKHLIMTEPMSKRFRGLIPHESRGFVKDINTKRFPWCITACGRRAKSKLFFGTCVNCVRGIRKNKYRALDLNLFHQPETSELSMPEVIYLSKVLTNEKHTASRIKDCKSGHNYDNCFDNECVVCLRPYRTIFAKKIKYLLKENGVNGDGSPIKLERRPCTSTKLYCWCQDDPILDADTDDFTYHSFLQHIKDCALLRNLREGREIFSRSPKKIDQTHISDLVPVFFSQTCLEQNLRPNLQQDSSDGHKEDGHVILNSYIPIPDPMQTVNGHQMTNDMQIIHGNAQQGQILNGHPMFDSGQQNVNRYSEQNTHYIVSNQQAMNGIQHLPPLRSDQDMSMTSHMPAHPSQAPPQGFFDQNVGAIQPQLALPQTNFDTHFPMDQPHTSMLGEDNYIMDGDPLLGFDGEDLDRYLNFIDDLDTSSSEMNLIEQDIDEKLDSSFAFEHTTCHSVFGSLKVTLRVPCTSGRFQIQEAKILQFVAKSSHNIFQHLDFCHESLSVEYENSGNPCHRWFVRVKSWNSEEITQASLTNTRIAEIENFVKLCLLGPRGLYAQTSKLIHLHKKRSQERHVEDTATACYEDNETLLHESHDKSQETTSQVQRPISKSVNSNLFRMAKKWLLPMMLLAMATTLLSSYGLDRRRQSQSNSVYDDAPTKPNITDTTGIYTQSSLPPTSKNNRLTTNRQLRESTTTSTTSSTSSTPMDIAKLVQQSGLYDKTLPDKLIVQTDCRSAVEQVYEAVDGIFYQGITDPRVYFYFDPYCGTQWVFSNRIPSWMFQKPLLQDDNDRYVCHPREGFIQTEVAQLYFNKNMTGITQCYGDPAPAPVRFQIRVADESSASNDSSIVVNGSARIEIPSYQENAFKVPNSPLLSFNVYTTGQGICGSLQDNTSSLVLGPYILSAYLRNGNPVYEASARTGNVYVVYEECSQKWIFNQGPPYLLSSNDVFLTKNCSMPKTILGYISSAVLRLGTSTMHCGVVEFAFNSAPIVVSPGNAITLSPMTRAKNQICESEIKELFLSKLAPSFNVFDITTTKACKGFPDYFRHSLVPSEDIGITMTLKNLNQQQDGWRFVSPVNSIGDKCELAESQMPLLSKPFWLDYQCRANNLTETILFKPNYVGDVFANDENPDYFPPLVWSSTAIDMYYKSIPEQLRRTSLIESGFYLLARCDNTMRTSYFKVVDRQTDAVFHPKIYKGEQNQYIFWRGPSISCSAGWVYSDTDPRKGLITCSTGKLFLGRSVSHTIRQTSILCAETVDHYVFRDELYLVEGLKQGTTLATVVMHGTNFTLYSETPFTHNSFCSRRNCSGLALSPDSPVRMPFIPYAQGPNITNIKLSYANHTSSTLQDYLYGAPKRIFTVSRCALLDQRVLILTNVTRDGLPVYENLGAAWLYYQYKCGRYVIELSSPYGVNPSEIDCNNNERLLTFKESIVSGVNDVDVPLCMGAGRGPVDLYLVPQVPMIIETNGTCLRDTVFGNENKLLLIPEDRDIPFFVHTTNNGIHVALTISLLCQQSKNHVGLVLIRSEETRFGSIIKEQLCVKDLKEFFEVQSVTCGNRTEFFNLSRADGESVIINTANRIDLGMKQEFPMTSTSTQSETESTTSTETNRIRTTQIASSAISKSTVTISVSPFDLSRKENRTAPHTSLQLALLGLAIMSFLGFAVSAIYIFSRKKDSYPMERYEMDQIHNENEDINVPKVYEE